MPELNFNALATQGPQGVFQGFMQGQQLQNRLAQQEQQRQLGELQLQNALREQRLAGEEEAAWKAGAGNPQAVLQQLQQRGLGKQAMALQGQLTKQQADKLAQQKTTVELVKNAANQVFANPQNAAQILQSFSQRTGIDVSDDLNQIQQLGGDVEAIKRWAAGNALEADKLLPKFQQFDQGGAVVTGTVDPLTGKFVQGTAFQKSMAPGEAQRIGLEARRVAVLEENQRRDADPAFQQRMAQAKVPAGYRLKTDGSLEFIPGGPADPASGGGKPLPEAAQKQVVGARNLQDAIDGYMQKLGTWGNAKMISPDSRAEMGNAYNNMMLQAKEAYNLGVLNGPDYDILQSVVKDPTKMGAVLTSNKALAGQAESLKNIAASIEKTVMESHGKKYVPRDNAKPDAKPKAPAAGTVQDGYRFKGGDPAVQSNWEKL